VIAATAWTFARARLPARLPGWAAFGGTFAALVLIFTPIAAGAEGGISPLGYWLYRIRFLAGRPDDPSLIPETIRVFWSISHAPPQPFTVLAFLLPLAFLVVPAASEIRALGNRSRVPAWLLAGVALGAIALFLLDRRAILVAALIVFPLVSGVFRGFGGRMKTRAVPAAIAAVIVFTSLPLVSGNPGATAAIGGLVGIHRGGGSDFVWVSVGNADRDLVRHLVSRTSTRRDVILAPPEIASLIPTFAGRATILTPGITTKTMAQKTVDALTAYYGDDDDLYTYCEALGATHVLYSIDLILDSSRYSPGYTAGTGGISEMTAVYRMHFEPEALRHFQLVYENDNFRLFRVTDDTKPTFLTDHPPVYQKRILEVHGDTIESFYNRIVDILFAYQSAVDAQSNGDEEGALRRLRYCLDQAPAFTYAWLRVGDSLLRLDRPADAFNAYNRVLQYAPDNRHALYYGALALGLEDRREEAVQLLELLLTSTADRGTRAQAAELKRAIESGQTITMPE
jgi:hypothetical protein